MSDVTDVQKRGVTGVSKQSGETVWLQPMTAETSLRYAVTVPAAVGPVVIGLFATPDDCQDYARQVKKSGSYDAEDVRLWTLNDKLHFPASTQGVEAIMIARDVLPERMYEVSE
jgi:hypothetical protein